LIPKLDLSFSGSKIKTLHYYSLLDNAVKKAPRTIPKRLYIIWCGSPLWATHRERIELWRRFNPSYRIFIAFDSARINAADVADQTFITKNNLELQDVREFKNKETEAIFNVFDKIYAQENKPNSMINYAAVSDFLRYLVIHKTKQGGGGWYVDTDMHPFDIPTKAPTYGFYIKMKIIKNATSYMVDFSPSVFGVVSDSAYCKAAYQILLAFASSPEINTMINMITSTENKCYTLATTNTTGMIGLFACELLKYKGASLLSLIAQMSIEADLLDNICIPEEMEIYSLNRECSWFNSTEKNMSHMELEKAIGPQKMQEILAFRNRLFFYCKGLPSFELSNTWEHKETLKIQAKM
jgi:hypothetical protein